MRKSVKLDSTANKSLLAAAIDRYLLSKDEPQIYGTQYQKLGEDEPWRLGKMDTTKISDAERIAYGVETLAQQREKVKSMNRRKLSELMTDSSSIDKIVKFISSENNDDSEYDLSERGINDFGYHLMSEGKTDEALKIFKLNTELYSQEFNTYDSYGECLLLLGQREKALGAYKKSLELNPNNTNAENIIMTYRLLSLPQLPTSRQPFIMTYRLMLTAPMTFCYSIPRRVGFIPSMLCIPRNFPTIVLG